MPRAGEQPVENGQVDEERAPHLRRRGWRLMVRSLRPSIGWVTLGIAASLIWAGTKIIIPLIAKQAIDKLDTRPFPTGAMAKYAAEIMAITVVTAVASSLRRYSAYALSWRSETDLRHRMFAHFQRLHF